MSHLKQQKDWKYITFPLGYPQQLMEWLWYSLVRRRNEVDHAFETYVMDKKSNDGFQKHFLDEISLSQDKNIIYTPNCWELRLSISYWD